MKSTRFCVDGSETQISGTREKCVPIVGFTVLGSQFPVPGPVPNFIFYAFCQCCRGNRPSATADRSVVDCYRPDRRGSVCGDRHSACMHITTFSVALTLASSRMRVRVSVNTCFGDVLDRLWSLLKPWDVRLARLICRSRNSDEASFSNAPRNIPKCSSSERWTIFECTRNAALLYSSNMDPGIQLLEFHGVYCDYDNETRWVCLHTEWFGVSCFRSHISWF